MNNEKDLEALGELIKKYRKEYPMNSAELAEKVGVSQSYISDLENGKKKTPRLDILEKVVAALGDKLNKQEKKRFYLNVLNMAGLYKEKKNFSYTRKKEIVPLADLVKSFENEESRPLEKKEFLLTYRGEDNSIATIRNYANSIDALFDLYNIGNVQHINTKEENGIRLMGNSATYYKGRKLTKNEIDQVKRLLEAILDQEKKQ